MLIKSIKSRKFGGGGGTFRNLFKNSSNCILYPKKNGGAVY